MKAAILFTILALGPADLRSWLAPFLRETNSSAASKRGVTLYRGGKPKEAAANFEKARAIAPAPLADFNLGTSLIRDGKLEEGAGAIERSMRQPSLRPDALYNRGSGALKAKALDHAIRDLTSSLRLRPGDRQAKRNLEIALQQKGESQSAQPPPQSKPEPSPDENRGKEKGEPKEEPGESSAEALLGSVQQQEREELARMRKSRPAPESIGW